MAKQLLCLAGAVFLVAGIAQADEQASPDAKLAHSAGGQYSAESKAPAASDKLKSNADKKADPVDAKLSVSAKPVYLDGGHFGGEQ